MLRIDRHIEVLLMKYDCVILPRFGGFVKHHVSASSNTSDGLLLPPHETVGFNPQLVLNDSLLVQSYVEAYDYSYPEAQTIVDEEVATLQQTLTTQQRCDIGTIGTLTRSGDGTISFEPHSEGLLVPHYYALLPIDTARADCFAARVEEDEESATTIAPLDDEEESSDDIVLRFSRRTLRRVAAVFVVLLLMASVPFIGRNVDTRQLASSINLGFLSFSTPAAATGDSDTAIALTTANKAESAPTVEAAATSKAETTDAQAAEEEVPQEVATPTEEVYTVVLASMISERNAQRFVETLHDKYDISAQVLPQGAAYRVVCGSFTSHEEAQQVRHTLAATTAIADAWVAKRKNL